MVKYKLESFVYNKQHNQYAVTKHSFEELKNEVRIVENGIINGTNSNKRTL